MTKTILLTGATDGLGFLAAKKLATQGHTLLIHGRSEKKLADTAQALSDISGTGTIQPYRADLSKLSDVDTLAQTVSDDHPHIDVIINNAGVFKTPSPVTDDGFDIRFMVNTIAPYLLTQRLLPRLSSTSRVVNLSSAAQAPVNLKALDGTLRLSDDQAYAQSKLAITMWSFHMASVLGNNGPIVIAVNPASLLASKMVKEAYGIDGKDPDIGADILVRAALSDEFANASGRYFDNDAGAFSQPHPDALDPEKNKRLVIAVGDIIGNSGVALT